MPLRALLDGNDVIAPRLSTGEWAALRADVRAGRRELVLPCCRGGAYGRTSPRGLQHFVHPPQSTCERSGETAEHLWAKAAVVQACAESGYEATPEWDEGPWRADVLAIRGAVRIAFEVQWTRQPLAVLIERQERYRRSGVRGCWLCREGPRELQRSGLGDLLARPDLPLFEIAWNGSGFTALLNGHSYDLGALVRALLGGRIAFRASATATHRSSLAVGLYRCRCWRCGGDADVYRLLHREHEASTRCGAVLGWRVPRPQRGRSDMEPEFHPRVRALVRELVSSDRGRELRIGMLSRVARDSARPDRVTTFACPGCGVGFKTLDLRRRPDRVVLLPVSEEDGAQLAWPHWCYLEDKRFCG
jgi:hypothetical protein